MPKLALPNKGRLYDEVRAALSDAGLDVRLASDRVLFASLGEGFTALFVRARDIPEFVADGVADAGITGWDCALESARELETLLDLGFGRCRLSVAVRAKPDGQPTTLDSVTDGARVATSFPRLAEQFFIERGCQIQLVPISGAAEVAPHLGIADAIVDLVSTGSTLRTNGLVEVATILESTARLICRPRPMLDPAIASALDDLALALGSVVRGRQHRYVMANVPRARLADVRDILPGLNGPTVIDVPGSDFAAVHAVVPERAVYRTTARLKALGCEGILVTRIERLL